MSLNEEIIALTERGNGLRFLRQLQQNIEQVIHWSWRVCFFQRICFGALLAISKYVFGRLW